MKTFFLLLFAAVSAQMPARDTLAARHAESRACEHEGGFHRAAEDGSYSLLSPPGPTF